MIGTLISSKTRIKLLIKFFLNSSNTGYLRNLEEEFGESSNGIRVELKRLEDAGFLETFNEGNKKMFKVNTLHPLFKDIHNIILKVVGLDKVYEYVLQRLGSLDKVYLIGKLARGQDSDIIDLVLVGNIDKAYLIEVIEKAEKKIDKKIRYIHFETEEFDITKIAEAGMSPLLVWEK